MIDARRFIALELSISTERLSRYRRSTHHLPSAIALYEQNIAISESFYTALQGLEICFRNKLHNALQLAYGSECLLQERLPLIPEGVKRLREAKEQFGTLRRSITEGGVIAELSLGFWVGLLGPPYDSSLWRNSLYRVFTSEGRFFRRKEIHGRFNAIRRFRNRVAHHEPIWDQDLIKRHSEIIEAIHWMCPVTADWVARRSRLPAVATQLKVGS